MKNSVIILLILAFSVSAQEKTEVYFDFNKDVPTKSSITDLQQWIKGNHDAVVTEIRGFCDSIDANDYNKQLASRRIGYVLKVLENSDAMLLDDIELKPFGEDFALSPDAAKNRRVEIFFRKSDTHALIETETPSANPSDVKKREEVFEGTTPDPSLESLFAKAEIGDIIRIRNINFYLNSEIVVPESEPRLLELYQSMLQNPKLSIEIHGHICCNPNINDTKLSYRRAKYIFTYLLKKGIPLNRLAYKGFGSSRPIHQIPERTLEEMAENRRVEIQIINIR
jgi:outer membrane protein OmpA-like peptidoglycan-associated protein